MHGHIISKQIKIKLVDTNYQSHILSYLLLSTFPKVKGKIQINFRDLWIYVFFKNILNEL